MWVLVTGGAVGLGAAICDSLAQERHKVLVHYRTSSPQPVLTACRTAGVEAEAIWGDLGDLEGMQRFLQSLPTTLPLTGLVNNVGPYFCGSLQSASADLWQRALFTNFLAPVLLAREVVARVQSHPASIVNIGVAGLNSGKTIRHCPVYSLCKSSLWSFTHALAQEVASQQIRVNMVSPGQMEGSVDLQPTGHLDPAKLPMKRAAHFQEVAGVVAFLISAQASYITGQNIEISGGYAL
jgi:NAD(P)-dependent dehydrogenase (short-subunit alcohol dehydrogenase family)